MKGSFWELMSSMPNFTVNEIIKFIPIKFVIQQMSHVSSKTPRRHSMNDKRHVTIHQTNIRRKKKQLDAYA